MTAVEECDGSALECRVEFRDETARVVPVGEFDIDTAPLVEECLDDVRGAGIGRVVLDLAETTFIDSAGLHVVLAWHERAGSERFTFAVTGAPGPVRRTIDASGVGAAVRFV